LRPAYRRTLPIMATKVMALEEIIDRLSKNSII